MPGSPAGRPCSTSTRGPERSACSSPARRACSESSSSRLPSRTPRGTPGRTDHELHVPPAKSATRPTSSARRARRRGGGTAARWFHRKAPSRPCGPADRLRLATRDAAGTSDLPARAPGDGGPAGRYVPHTCVVVVRQAPARGPRPGRRREGRPPDGGSQWILGACLLTLLVGQIQARQPDDRAWSFRLRTQWAHLGSEMAGVVVRKIWA
jgi:hypothetical protein